MQTKAPRPIVPLLLAAGLFALGGTTYWLEYGKKPQDEANQAAEKKVFDLGKDPIREVSLQGHTEKSTLDVKLGCGVTNENLCQAESTSKWEMLSPLKAKADDVTVNSLVKNIAGMAASERIDLRSETAEKRAVILTDYGLSTGQRSDINTRKIRFSLSNGKTRTAYFGVKNPISDGIFALLEKDGKVDENLVYLIPDWQLSVFEQKTSYFRDKRLFSLNEKEVSELEITSPDQFKGTLRLKKLPLNDWDLKLGSQKAAGDSDAVEGVLSGLSFLSAKDFVSENKSSEDAKKTLAGSREVYSAVIRSGANIKTLHVREKLLKAKDSSGGKILYAFTDGQDPLVEIDRANFEKINRSFQDFRVTKLIPTTQRFSFSTITVSRKGKNPFHFTLEKDAGAWMLEGKAIPQNKVEALLDRLSSKVVKEFSSTPSSPSGNALTLSFHDAKEISLVLEFWKVGVRLYVRDPRHSGPETWELMSDLDPLLPWNEADFTTVKKGNGS